MLELNLVLSIVDYLKIMYIYYFLKREFFLIKMWRLVYMIGFVILMYFIGFFFWLDNWYCKFGILSKNNVKLKFWKNLVCFDYVLLF